jgi:hypothetical protein
VGWWIAGSLVLVLIVALAVRREQRVRQRGRGAHTRPHTPGKPPGDGYHPPHQFRGS